MKRYFFHLRRKEGLVRDHKGEEVHGARALYTCARIKARDHLAAALFNDEDYTNCSIEVMSEQGTIVFELPLLKALTF